MARYALIAISDSMSARRLREIIAAVGVDVVVARDGAEARSLLDDRGAPALFITELSLPRADGFTLLGELRRIANVGVCPALVLSSSPAFRSTAWSLRHDLGIRGVFSSAAPDADLRDAVRDLLGGARAVETPPPASPAEAALGEKARLARIARMGIVDDRPPEEALQKLAEDTAKAFDVPIALVSLVLDDRQWFKAYYGLSEELARARGTERELSFCRHVVEADGYAPLIVPDATVHPYFSSNPLVRQGIIRSYAGAPLVTPAGHVLGTLCIIDTKPLNIGLDEVDALVRLARRVAGELELRSTTLLARRHGESGPTLALMEAICSSVESGILVLDANRKVLMANQALADLFGVPVDRIVKMTREEFVLENSILCEDRADYLRKMNVLPDGPFSARETFELARPRRRVVRWIAKPIQLPSGIGQLDIFDDVTAEIDRARESRPLKRGISSASDAAQPGMRSA